MNNKQGIVYVPWIMVETTPTILESNFNPKKSVKIALIKVLIKIYMEVWNENICLPDLRLYCI